MTSEEKNLLAKTYFEIGELHGRTISKDTLITLVNSFQDLPFRSVFNALNEWMMNGTHFPLPAHIRQKIVPVIDDKDNALDAVNRVISAVSKYGYTNPLSAREFIGELGWETVTRFGGWKGLCEHLNGENEGVLRAQLRELALVVSKKAKRDELDLAPALPSPAVNDVAALIGSTMKRLE